MSNINRILCKSNLELIFSRLNPINKKTRNIKAAEKQRGSQHVRNRANKKSRIEGENTKKNEGGNERADKTKSRTIKDDKWETGRGNKIQQCKGDTNNKKLKKIIKKQLAKHYITLLPFVIFR